MQLNSVLFFLTSWILFSSCEKVDKEEQVPAYLRIEKIDLMVKPDGTQGSNAHDIVDAWVLADGELIGVFEMPCIIPILKKDSTEIIVFAGVRVNGQQNNRKFYPFYEVYKQKVFLEPLKIDTLNPVTTYREGVKFSWIEDFEDFNVSMIKSGVTRTVDTMFITSEPDEVYQFGTTGNKYSGKVDFRSKIGTFENSTIQSFDLPRATTDVFLEVNYKSDVAIQFGLYPGSSSGFEQGVPVYIGFPSKEVWKKAYIRLTDEVNNQEYAGKQFRLFIHAINTVDEPAKILFDNLKIVHF
ncbi:MAG: hypothetical protein H6605_08035 [Flavobacteriales bacterium]|nr:hypothetical protein [Flavobacteriales bacterium]